jgi:hypothetical protein
MPHEPSRSRPPVQPTSDRRCPSCRAVKPPEDFLDGAGTAAGCCGSCRRRRTAVARRHRQCTLRRVVDRAEAGYRALLAHHAEGGGGGAA